MWLYYINYLVIFCYLIINIFIYKYRHLQQKVSLSYINMYISNLNIVCTMYIVHI